MSLLNRIGNVFRKRRLYTEIDEELADHIAEAIESGRPRAEAERALGSALRHREDSAEIRLVGWLDSLWADAVFGMRQLRRRPVVTAAAVLSLALAIGAVTSAFRLIDAVLLRPLPVADPYSLYSLAYTRIDHNTGVAEEADAFSYPMFVDFREAVKGKADLILISYGSRVDVTIGSDSEMERMRRQYVSGNHFQVLGVQPRLGRNLTEADNRKPGGHPVAVISHAYWMRRFGSDPNVIGRTYRQGDTVYQIAGVAAEGYTGTEPGMMTDVFVPAMQNHRAVHDARWAWARILLRPKDGHSLVEIQAPLQATLTARRRESLKHFPPDVSKERREEHVNSELRIHAASAGVSGTQKTYRRSLLVLGAVVVLVLLIACANVANLMSAQAAARGKEMALRISIGAGRGRLLRLLLVECLMLAMAATAVGAIFAWWSAPFVVSMIGSPGNPLQLHMPADWRVLGFCAMMALGVTVLFGLGPAIRACRVEPVSALKGGEDPQARRRLMYSLVAAQVAFCFLVHFVAGLFVSTFERIASRPAGFEVDHILTLETDSRVFGPARKRPQHVWEQVAARLRSAPAVESTAICGWALMSGNGWSSDIRIGGRLQAGSEPYFLSVSPAFFETMRIPLIDGREFLSADKPATVDAKGQAVDGVAVVNESFARAFFNGENPVGKTFERLDRDNIPTRNLVVGYVRDARYRNMREPMQPTAFVPLGAQEWSTFLVRTNASDAGSLASPLRKLVSEIEPDFHVTNAVTQSEIVRGHTIRERLLATLSLFFAIVALILAVVGLYGVLHYAVVQRRRELGIRIALGARSSHVVRQVASSVAAMLLLGSAVGLGAGLLCEGFLRSLLFEVKGTELQLLATPLIAIFAAACLAAIPPVLHAARTDPARALRAE